VTLIPITDNGIESPLEVGVSNGRVGLDSDPTRPIHHNLIVIFWNPYPAVYVFG